MITKNIADYRDVDINVLAPKDFLNLEETRRIIEAKDDSTNNP